MSFDPEKVERYSPLSSGGMGSDEMGGFVLYFEYAQLLTLLHEVSSDANPAGTLRELRLAQDTIRALEKLIEELRVRAAIEFVHPLYLKCMRMRLEPEMECERDRKTVQWVLEAEIKTMYDRLKEERK